MEYKNLNDYELIYQVRENDGIAYNAIFSKYSHLIDILTKKYLKNNSNIGLEYDDLYQEGMLGLSRAIDSYDSDDTLFYTFALLCIRREMEKIIKGNKRNKHMILNDSLSLNKPINAEEDIFLEDIISTSFLIENDCDINDDYNYLINLKYEFPIEESLIYELKVNNFSTKEIAILLDKNYKNINYHIRKIRKKLKQLLENKKNMIK